MNKRRKHRSWFRRMLGKVNSLLSGPAKIILSVALVINDAIFTLDQKIGGTGTTSDINPTVLEEKQAENILKTKAIPTLNLIENNLNKLLSTSKSPEDIIIELNLYLKQIATLQAWVSMEQNSLNKNVVDYMVSAVIEPLLVGLNTIATNVLKANNLNSKVTINQVSFIASDIVKVIQFDINWQNKTVATFQKISNTSNSNSTEEVEIIASINNDDYNIVIPEVVNANIKPQKTNKLIPLLFGAGIFFVLKKLSKD